MTIDYSDILKSYPPVITLEQLYHLLGDMTFSPLSMRLLLEIWREAALIKLEDFGDALHISLLPSLPPQWEGYRCRKKYPRRAFLYPCRGCRKCYQ